MRKKVLLFGGKGFIGSRLAHFMPSSYDLITSYVRTYDQDKVSIIFDKVEPDFVIDATGRVDYDFKSFYPIIRDNVLGVINLLRFSAVPVVSFSSFASLEADSNIYAVSKSIVDQISFLSDLHRVVKIPAIIDKNRKTGVVYKIFLAHQEKKRPVVIDSNLKYWNCMTLDCLCKTFWKNFDVIIDHQFSFIGHREKHNFSSVKEIYAKRGPFKSDVILKREPTPFSIVDACFYNGYVEPVSDFYCDMDNYYESLCDR